MRSLSRRMMGAAAVALAVGSAACGREGDAAAATGGPGGMGMEDRIVPVEVATVTAGRIARDVSVSGVVEPIRTIGVNSQLAGALRTVVVEESDAVRAGQVLATLDDRELAAQLRSAEAGLEVARAAWERAEQLWARQVITAAEYERDQAAFAAATAQVDQLRTRQGYATVRSPLSGVIIEKNVEAGDIVGVQTRLFSIADLSTMVVRVRVSELEVVEIEPGAIVEVRLDAFPARAFAGRVRRVFPAADPATRLVPVEVALQGEAAATARPGFLARVTFGLQAKENVLLVPASAIVGGEGNEGVFVVETERVERRPVRVGLTSQGRVEILQGLEAGELIVSVGTNNLRDGATVRVVEPTGAPSPPVAQPGG